MTDSVRRTDTPTIDAIDIKKAAIGVVKNRPITISLWVIGLILAVFGTGCGVNELQVQKYNAMLEQASRMDETGRKRAVQKLEKKQEIYYKKKGWFWQCDPECQTAYEQMQGAQAAVDKYEEMVQEQVNEARRKVGIWSSIGVQDVRNKFWSAWQTGKDMAMRHTMFDAFFMMMPGSREETLLSVIAKLVMQYIINLTFGLICSLFIFLYTLYGLIISYGESMLSGLAFFLVVLIAGTATLATYLFAIYGTVLGGGYYLAKQAALHDDARGGRRQHIGNQQQHMYRPSSRRYHHD